jgi:hypothetical protein
MALLSGFVPKRYLGRVRRAAERMGALITTVRNRVALTY